MRSSLTSSLLPLLIPLLAAAQSPPDAGVPPDLGAAHCQGNSCTQPSGLRYLELRQGKGETPRPGARITIHYTGWFANGKRFDTSRGKRPWSFTWGKGEVIRGYEEGMQGMRVGGRRKLIIPPALAYGDKGFKNIIPPGAELIFDVELLSVR